MPTLYAWSPIRYGDQGGKDGPGATETLNVGDEVTKSALGLDDSQWDQLLRSGAVRLSKPPEMPTEYMGSPIDFLKEEAARASEGAVNEVMASPAVLDAITASNMASNATASLPENVDPDVLAEQLRQQDDSVPTNAPDVQYRTNQLGALMASDDEGNSWRPATEAERVEQANS